MDNIFEKIGGGGITHVEYSPLYEEELSKQSYLGTIFSLKQP